MTFSIRNATIGRNTVKRLAVPAVLLVLLYETGLVFAGIAWALVVVWELQTMSNNGKIQKETMEEFKKRLDQIEAR